MDCLDRLRKAHVFTKIELASGYHYVKMAGGYEFKTTFTTHYGTYEWLVLSVSLTNATIYFLKVNE